MPRLLLYFVLLFCDELLNKTSSRTKNLTNIYKKLNFYINTASNKIRFLVMALSCTVFCKALNATGVLYLSFISPLAEVTKNETDCFF
jgi:hypothetical protein